LALAHNLSGLEVLYDIPSSIGGSIVMNAGAYDEDISHIIKDVTFWDQSDQNIRTLPKEALHLSYRNSIFQQDKRKLILQANLVLRESNKNDIKYKMDTIKARRWEKQPREYPNAGSVFKRPQGRYVGPMLDALQLKGYSYNGFRVSPKHSGFIEKVGCGNGADLLHLITDIQAKVSEAFDVKLELEQRIIRDAVQV
jgi:UDP-N-acetylmuramate dehydrogenase